MATYGIGCERVGTGTTYRPSYYVVVDGKRVDRAFETCEAARAAWPGYTPEAQAYELATRIVDGCDPDGIAHLLNAAGRSQARPQPPTPEEIAMSEIRDAYQLRQAERIERERLASITAACPVGAKLYRVFSDETTPPTLRVGTVVKVTPAYLYLDVRVYGWNARLDKGLVGREVWQTEHGAWAIYLDAIEKRKAIALDTVHRMTSYITQAEDALEQAAIRDGDRGQKTVPVSAVVESFHLDAFIDPEEE